MSELRDACGAHVVRSSLPCTGNLILRGHLMRTHVQSPALSSLSRCLVSPENPSPVRAAILVGVPTARLEPGFLMSPLCSWNIPYSPPNGECVDGPIFPFSFPDTVSHHLLISRPLFMIKCTPSETAGDIDETTPPPGTAIQRCAEGHHSGLCIFYSSAGSRPYLPISSSCRQTPSLFSINDHSENI